MKTDDLMTRARSANPVSPVAFHDWADTPDGQELVNRIVASPIEEREQKRGAMRRPRSLVAGATAVLVILGITSIRPSEQPTPRTESTWAAPVVAIAQDAPRLLVTGDGWHITRADEFSSKYGEMTFEDGTYTVDLRWIPAKLHGARVRSVKSSSIETSWTTTIAGREAVLFQYEGTTIFVALWRDDRHSLELFGTFPDVESFKSVAGRVVPVDVDTWLSAMPESVVKPDRRAASVDEMLADIPLHPSVDVAKLQASEWVSDRYQLGAKVTGAVACAWIKQWVGATADGGGARAEAAVNAMATSHDWAILKEMTSEGSWPEVLWEFADAMPTDDPVSGGRPMSIEEAYSGALGCEAYQ